MLERHECVGRRRAVNVRCGDPTGESDRQACRNGVGDWAGISQRDNLPGVRSQERAGRARLCGGSMPS